MAHPQHFPSDLLLQEGSPPAVRIHGTLNSTKVPALKESDLTEMLTEITPDSLWKQIEQKKRILNSFTPSLRKPGIE